jgi:hypothetical protein
VTPIVAGLVVTISLALGGLFGVFVGAATDRTRAQTAADAAALAAVAESAPGSRGLHEAAAERLARSNGGELISCEGCEPGTTSVIVTVSVDGVEARARATLDPNAFLPADLGFDGYGLHPTLERSVKDLIAAGRGQIRLVSGWRSRDRQEELWSAALARYGDPEVADDWVARPGTSMHERGLAVDLGGDLELAASLVERLDLPMHRPLPNEPWHFELLGGGL